MDAFHRQRVEVIPLDEAPLPLKDKRVLVVHLFPLAAVQGGLEFAGAELKKHARLLPALGDTSGQNRFNVDGYLVYNSMTNPRSYAQLFRNGCVEAAMAEIAYAAGQDGSYQIVRDNYCEKVVFDFVRHYLKFCAAAGITAPIRMYSAIIGCKGAHFSTHYGDPSDHSIDRSPAILPSVEIVDLDADVIPLLRRWCDTFAQAAGLERSLSFDDDGAWHERRR